MSENCWLQFLQVQIFGPLQVRPSIPNLCFWKNWCNRGTWFVFVSKHSKGECHHHQQSCGWNFQVVVESKWCGWVFLITWHSFRYQSSSKCHWSSATINSDQHQLQAYWTLNQEGFVKCRNSGIGSIIRQHQTWYWMTIHLNWRLLITTRYISKSVVGWWILLDSSKMDFRERMHQWIESLVQMEWRFESRPAAIDMTMFEQECEYVMMDDCLAGCGAGELGLISCVRFRPWEEVKYDKWIVSKEDSATLWNDLCANIWNVTGKEKFCTKVSLSNVPLVFSCMMAICWSKNILVEPWCIGAMYQLYIMCTRYLQILENDCVWATWNTNYFYKDYWNKGVLAYGRETVPTTTMN